MLFAQLTPTRDSTSELLDAPRHREVAVFGHSTPGQTRTPNGGNGIPKFVSLGYRETPEKIPKLVLLGYRKIPKKNTEMVSELRCYFTDRPVFEVSIHH